jgi:hypothetical protein
MSSPELWETYARMLKVTGGRWPRNVPIPWAAGEDVFTSRLARYLKIFPYGRNVGAVVSAVMEKDRQDVQRKKRRAHVRLAGPRREVKVVRPSAKPIASDVGMAPPAAPASGRRPPSPPHIAETTVAGAEGVSMELSMDDYLMGGVTMFDAQMGLPPADEFF